LFGEDSRSENSSDSEDVGDTGIATWQPMSDKLPWCELKHIVQRERFSKLLVIVTFIANTSKHSAQSGVSLKRSGIMA